MNELIAALTKAGAPLLGTLIGGPVGALAGAAVGALSEALGTPATPEAVKEAIVNRPGAEAIVRQVEAEKAPGILEAYLRDVQDARATTLQLVDKGSVIAWGAPAVSVLIVVGFLSLVGALLFKQVPDSQVALVLFGTLSTAFGSVVSYWLGSSAGSARSADTIRNIAQQAATPTAGQMAGKAIDAAIKTAARK